MALLDEIGKKLTQAGQTAVQKTKEMTDIAKYNGMISDEQGRISNLMLQVGQAYFNEHCNDINIDPQYADYFISIREAYAKIDTYQNQIKTIKGLEKCPSCGAYVSAESPFCSSCGCKLKVNNTKICSKCGASIDSESLFCTSCGNKIETVSKEPSIQPTGVENVDKIVDNENDDSNFVGETVNGGNNESESGYFYCSNCREMLNDGTIFCTNCGTKVER